MPGSQEAAAALVGPPSGQSAWVFLDETGASPNRVVRLLDLGNVEATDSTEYYVEATELMTLAMALGITSGRRPTPDQRETYEQAVLAMEWPVKLDFMLVYEAPEEPAMRTLEGLVRCENRTLRWTRDVPSARDLNAPSQRRLLTETTYETQTDPGILKAMDWVCEKRLANQSPEMLGSQGLRVIESGNKWVSLGKAYDTVWSTLWAGAAKPALISATEETRAREEAEVAAVSNAAMEDLRTVQDERARQSARPASPMNMVFQRFEGQPESRVVGFFGVPERSYSADDSRFAVYVWGYDRTLQNMFGAEVERIERRCEAQLEFRNGNLFDYKASGNHCAEVAKQFGG